jgi:hypothetical protein
MLLENQKVRFEFDRETGVLSGGWNVETEDKYIDYSSDVYEIECESGATRIDESQDTVTNDPRVVLRDGYYEIIFECKNTSAQDLRITKKYLLGQDDNKLIKRFSFASSADKVVFIKLIDNVNITPDLRTGGYYHTSVRNEGTRHIVPASDVVTEQKANSLNTWYAFEFKMTTLVNVQKGDGVGVYRYKLDGEWVSPVIMASDMPRLYYTPQGWSMGVLVDRLSPEGTSEVEVHYVIFEGDHISFYQSYLETEEVALIRSTTKIPEWVLDMKLVFGNWYSEREPREMYFNRVKNVLKTFPEGYIAIPAIRWNAVWGDYYIQDKMLGTYGDEPIDADWLEESLDMLHQMSPRIKHGLYTFRWTLGEDSETYAKHPDWVVYGKSGKPVFMLPSDGRGANGFTSNLKLEYAEYILGQYRAMFEKYGSDILYLDGEPRGINLINWKENEVIQDNKWMSLLKNMYKIVREQGDDTAMWHNSSGDLLSDIAYVEFPGDLYGSMTKNGWQTIADRLIISKLRAHEDSAIAILYWYSQHKERYNEPIYSNYTIGLGFKPVWCVLINLGAYGNASLVDAAYEVRHMKLLVNTGLEPLWWKEDIDIEAHTLKQGNAHILSVINHGESGDTVVSVDTQRFGLEVGKPAYIWEFPRKHPFKDPEVNSMFDKLGDEVADLRESGNMPLAMEQKFRGKVDLDVRLAVELRIDEDLLTMVSVSHVPAVVRAVDGQRLNFYLPTTMGVNIDGGKLEDGVCRLSVDSNRKEAEIVVYIPDDLSLSAVEIDGNIVDHHVEDYGGHSFAIITVTRGKHEIYIQ